MEVEDLPVPTEGTPAARPPRMSRQAQLISVLALIAIAVGVPATAAGQTQIPSHVRVLIGSEPIMRWLGPQTDVILVVDQGTTLEVIDFDREEDSYWVVLPPDLHGTRKVGWIRAGAVERYVATPAAAVAPPAFPSEAPRNDAQAQVPIVPATSAPVSAEDSVTLSVRRDAPAASSGDAGGAKKSYTFEDVHFERDRHSIRSEDMDKLRVAATTLKDEPSLVVTIEGHTCSLGTETYNRALGSLRANAVKEYLVSAGVPADRLLTVSQGEAGAEHDNSREATRRLNRRVALVPKIPR
jgi:outer membrane protein OmpA-like peptidoglycan-associated protein